MANKFKKIHKLVSNDKFLIALTLFGKDMIVEYLYDILHTFDHVNSQTVVSVNNRVIRYLDQRFFTTPLYVIEDYSNVYDSLIVSSTPTNNITKEFIHKFVDGV